MRRCGRASKGKGIAGACAVEKAQTLQQGGAPPPKKFEAKKGDLRNKYGVVGGRFVHAVRVSLFCFEFSLVRLRRLGAPP